MGIFTYVTVSVLKRKRPISNVYYSSALDSIETTLNNLCAKMTIVESDVSKLKDAARVTEDNLKKMDDGLQWMNTEMEGLKL